MENISPTKSHSKQKPPKQSHSPRPPSVERSRTLIVSRDQSGYGLTLSGDQPVFVQTVRQGGAADRAGVREHDIIVKVNGQRVTEASHSEVVELIQAGRHVALTVIQSGSSPVPPSLSSGGVTGLGGSNSSLETSSSTPPPTSSSSASLRTGRPISSSGMPTGRASGLSPSGSASSLPAHSGSKSLANRDRITPPQPPNTEAMRVLTGEKLHTMQLMVEEERRNVEQLRQEMAVSQQSQAAKLQPKLEQAVKRLAVLEEQLEGLKTGKSPGRPQSVILTNVPSRPAPVPPPRPEMTSQSCSLPTSVSTPALSAATTVPPPPLPARNKPNPILTEDGDPETPPPLPPPRQMMPLPAPPLAERRSNQHSPRRSQTSSGMSSSLLAPKHERTRSSPSSLTDFVEETSAEALAAGRISPRYETPPGTPPPPYSGGQRFNPEFSPDVLVTWDNLTGGEAGDSGIINMEDEDDDDLSDQESGPGNSALSGLIPGLFLGLGPSEAESHKTPFDNLRDLMCHHAHLAVFLNYVVSNSDPSSLFFYLITETYKMGLVKEMQRWAYEIHSSFLVPGAPLAVPNIEHAIVNEIDRGLQEDFDKETVLRKLFWKARAKARKDLKEQLSEFRDKRVAGLGSIYGPPDHELKLCIDNRNKELQVIDDLLVPFLDSLSEDLENATDRTLTIAASLATILAKTFNTRSQTAAGLIEKCPCFVSKEKKSKIFGRNKKSIQVHGHHFEPTQYYQVTFCSQSQQMIWGIAPQGYRCSACNFDVHKKFVHRVEETCVGPSSKQRSKSRPFIQRFMSDLDNSKKPTTPGVANKDVTALFHVYDDSANADQDGATPNKQGEGRRGAGHDAPDHSLGSTTSENVGPEKPPTSPQGGAEALPPSQQQQTTNLDSPVAKASNWTDRWPPNKNQVGGTSAEHPPRSGAKVDRSQSCKIDKKDPKRGTPRDRRKHSDPSIPRSSTSDVDAEVHPSIANHHSGSSSTSSLSARSSLDSPAGSTQEMTHGRPGVVVQPVTPSSVGSLSTLTTNASSTTLSGSDTASASHFQQTYEDSDFETEPDPPDWRLSISQEELTRLKPKERKRQDVINEFFQTERSHVRNLKVLDRLFCRPLLESSHMSKELIERLFPNLEDVLAVHTKYNQRMKDRIKAGFPIGNVGDILSEMFDGANGETLIHVGSEFTKNQKFSIEELKDRRRKDHKLDLFLAEQERRPECRRLQLPSILPVEHQRLVKYPLLLEQLLKQCDREADPEEYNIVKRCVDRTREILESIDRQVAEAQNIQRLAEIQRFLDTTGLEKMPDNAICAEYRNLDLTKHRLIYDGPLTLKLGDTRRFKTVDLHVLLLEDCIMLLQKQDDKFLLKFHTSTAGNTGVGGQGNSGKFCHSPVVKLSTMIYRPVATDKRAFYLLNTTQNGPQIYELVASSTADRSQWFRHITEASNAYKARENRRSYRGPGLGSDSPLSSHNGLVDSVSKSDAVSADSLDLPGDKKGQPAGRSQSFHEHSISNMEPHPERQPSSPPEDLADQDNFASKTGGEDPNSVQRKRLQRVEILKIAEPCPLIDPSQVVVTQGEILVADPVLTPIEKLRRKDLEVSKALEEKQRLIADILHIPIDDFDNIVDIASQPSPDRDAREVLLAALAQAKCLSDLVNESLSLSEEDTIVASAESFRLSSPPKEVVAATSASSPAPTPSNSTTGASEQPQPPQSSVKRGRFPGPPADKLIGITSSMNQHLTSLLAIIQERDDERDRLRRELLRSQEQVHSLLSQSSVRTSSLSATSPASRPASFISVEESSAADNMSEKNHESEDDAAVGGSKTSDSTERNGSTDESPEQGNGADHTLTEEVNNKVGTDSDEHDQFVDASDEGVTLAGSTENKTVDEAVNENEDSSVAKNEDESTA